MTVELNKTKCLDCGHVNVWQSFKWADSEQRKEHNRLNNTTCPKCKSTHVKNVEDNDTMGPYRAIADAIIDIAAKPEREHGQLGGYPDYVAPQVVVGAGRGQA